MTAIEEGIQKIGLPLFILAFLTTSIATGISVYTIALHLKNYRRPDLQRLTIRILLMYKQLICMHADTVLGYLFIPLQQ